MTPHIPGAEFGGRMIRKGTQKSRDYRRSRSETKEIYNRAKKLYDLTKKSLDEQLTRTNFMLEVLGITKVKASTNQMQDFVGIYRKFKNVNWSGGIDTDNKLATQKARIKSMNIKTMAAKDVLKAFTGGAAAGSLVGIAAYGGVGAFAAASTGTAIATLHGAAATNAILAWFGGGSIAAGGLGVTAGALVLSGIVIVPALATLAVLIKAGTRNALAKVKKYEQDVNKAVKEMNIASDTAVSIFNLAYDYNEFIIAFNERFKEAITSVKGIYKAHSRRKNSKVDFRELNQREREKLHVAWLMAQIMQALLDRKLIDEKCQLDTSAVKFLEHTREQCIKSKYIS